MSMSIEHSPETPVSHEPPKPDASQPKPLTDKEEDGRSRIGLPQDEGGEFIRSDREETRKWLRKKW